MKYLDRIGGRERYEVLNLIKQEARTFTLETYWLKGHFPNLPYSHCIQGISGPETVYQRVLYKEE